MKGLLDFLAMGIAAMYSTWLIVRIVLKLRESPRAPIAAESENAETKGIDATSEGSNRMEYLSIIIAAGIIVVSAVKLAIQPEWGVVALLLTALIALLVAWIAVLDIRGRH